MAILDHTAKVVVSFKGDTTDLKAKLKDLQGEEKRLAETQLSGANARNKQLENWNAKLGAVAIRIAAVAAAAKVAFDGMEFSAERARMRFAAQGVSIDNLRKATGGLRSETDLLQQAVRLQHGAYKLTEEQMTLVLRAQRQLVREGHDQEDVTRKVLKAVTELEGGALKEFGFRLREGSTDSEKLSIIMGALAEKSRQLGDEQLTAAEKWTKHKVAVRDWVDTAKEAIFAPSRFAPEEILKQQQARTRREQDEFRRLHEATPAFGASLFSERLPGAEPTNFAGLLAGGIGSARLGAFRLVEGMSERFGKLAENIKVSAERSKELREELRRLANDEAKRVTDDLVERLEAEQAASDSADALARASAVISGSFSLSRDSLGGLIAQQGLEQGELEQVARTESFLERTFGPVDQFSLYAAAFSTLTGAVSSSLDAWITGSATAGQAFKKFISEAVKSVALQMSVEALKHAAFAIGFAAIGDPRASLHAKAAAMFAAGAAVGIGVAKSLHGSGGGAGSASGAAPGGGIGASGGVGGSQQGQHVVYVIGDNFSDHSPRRRQQSFKRMASQAIGAGGVQNR